MPIRWNCEECKAWQEVKGLPEDNIHLTNFGHLRYTLSNILIAVGFPPGEWVITRGNWQEVYTRVYMWERIFGGMRNQIVDDKMEQVYFMPQEIYSMIGFHVNAGTKTKTEFQETICHVMRAQAERNISDYLDKIDGQKATEQSC